MSQRNMSPRHIAAVLVVTGMLIAVLVAIATDPIRDPVCPPDPTCSVGYEEVP
jgi:hypothetical protein